MVLFVLVASAGWGWLRWGAIAHAKIDPLPGVEGLESYDAAPCDLNLNIRFGGV